MKCVGLKLSVHSIKELGLTVTPNLKFPQQGNELVKKANRMMGFLKRKSSFTIKDVLSGQGGVPCNW